MTLASDRSVASRTRALSTRFLLFLSAILCLTVPSILQADLLVSSHSASGYSILRFSDTGAFLGTFVAAGSGGLQYPGRLVFGPDGNLYVSDALGRAVLRYNGSTGAFIDAFVPAATGGLTQPLVATFGPDGNLYVADYVGPDTGVVRKYNGTTGASMGIFIPAGHLDEPFSLAFGPDGNLYAADVVNVVKFNGTTGAFMSIFVPSGSGGIYAPEGITFGSDGNLYVGSAHTGVMLYNGTTGAFIRQLVPWNGSDAPLVAFGPDANLYVGYFQGAGSLTDYVARFNGQTGSLIGTFVAPGAIGIIQGMVFTPGSGVPTQVQPTHGGNAGLVTVQVIGSGFQAGATVKLTGLGPDITGTNTTIPYPSALATTFDLTGATPGVRNVVVTNPDHTASTLTGGFTVEQGGAAQISVDIIGRSQIRIGAPQTYYVQAVNSGSVDSGPGIVSLDIPTTVASQQLSGNDLFVAGNTNALEFGVPQPTDAAQGRVLLLATTAVPAGGSQVAPVSLTLPPNVPSRFTITAAWQPSIANLSFDRYLTAVGLAPIPFQTTCSQCYTQAVSQADAFNGAQAAYTTWQISMQDVSTEQNGLCVSVGTVLAMSATVTALGLSAPEGLALGAVIASGTFFVNHFFDPSSDPDANLRDLVNNIGRAAIDFRGDAFLRANPIVLKLLTAFDAVVAGAQGVGSIDEATGAERAAWGAFQQKYNEYQVARNAYRECLKQSCGAPQEPPPPPPLAGTDSLDLTGVSSLDPNDKIGPAGAGSASYIGGQRSVGYSMYFENQPTATAPAQSVTITDPLNTNLDLNTLTLGPITFPNQVITPPSIPLSVAPFATTVDLRPTTNLLVKISASLNATTGILTWSFQSLDPATSQPPTDPLAGFLPPVAEGSVFFTVMPKSTVTTGTVIQNTATVVFDVNPPINTPTWFNTIDNTKPTSHVNPLAATQTATSFTVSWAGSDVGAGVQDFTVYASDNGGPFTAWQTNTTALSAMFTGIGGHTYGFYSIARDLVGNVETSKSSADTTTTITAPAPLTVTTVSLSGGVVAAAYSQTLVAMGGTPPYLWTVSGGRLPIGLTLNATTGQITGTPMNPLSSFVTFKVTDAGVPVQTATVSLTFAILPNTFTITTTSLPNGQVGIAYLQTVATIGGMMPFTWELGGGGALPPGLTLNTSTGVISGTPVTAVTNYRLLLRVTDSTKPTPQTASTSFTLTIVPNSVTVN